MKQLIVSVDPGASSMSMSLMDKTTGDLVDNVDIRSTSNGHAEPEHIVNVLRLWRQVADQLFLEKAASRPSQGVSSTGKFLEAYGMVIGSALSLDYDLTIINPRMWKKHYGIPSKSVDRYSALEHARKLWPELASSVLKLKKNLDRADSLLIGEYARVSILRYPPRRVSESKS